MRNIIKISWVNSNLKLQLLTFKELLKVSLKAVQVDTKSNHQTVVAASMNMTMVMTYLPIIEIKKTQRFKNK